MKLILRERDCSRGREGGRRLANGTVKVGSAVGASTDPGPKGKGIGGSVPKSVAVFEFVSHLVANVVAVHPATWAPQAHDISDSGDSARTIETGVGDGRIPAKYPP